jgi:hypothetical protein
MVKIYLADGTLVYTCVFPCGENQLQITYKADYSPNTPNVGLSTSVQNLKFVKSDRTAILGIMSEDLFVQIDTLPKYQLDITNFTDDGNTLEIPLISSSVRDILKNTNLGQIGINRATKLHINKTPYLRGVLTSSEVGTTIYVLQQTNKIIDIAKEWTLNEGVFLNLETSDQASNFLYRNVPISGNGTSAIHNTDIVVNLTLETLDTPPAPARAYVNMQSYYTVNYADGTQYTGVLGNASTSYMALAQVMNFTLNASFPSYTTFANTHNTKAVESCVIAYQLRLIVENNGGSAFLIEYNRAGTIEVKYQDYVDYIMPSVKFTDVVTNTASSLGIQIDKSYVGTALDNLYLTSPNGEEFWNTPIFDILDTIANLFGLLLQITLTGVNLRTYSIIYSGASIAVPDFCNHKTNGKTYYYKFAINDGTNPKLQYANAPVIMWNNEYEGFRRHSSQQIDTLQLKLKVNGADFLEKMSSDDKSVYLIEGRGNTISDGSDLPINYQFSASEITAYRAGEYASELLGDIIVWPVVDTTPVFTNPETSRSTRDDINLPSTRLAAMQIDKFSVPFYSNLISKVLNGDIIKLSIDGDDYLLVDVTCGIEPSQVEITCRKILT